jgi:hypothetical protein
MTRDEFNKKWDYRREGTLLSWGAYVGDAGDPITLDGEFSVSELIEIAADLESLKRNTQEAPSA